jgi:hypothetical protein
MGSAVTHRPGRTAAGPAPPAVRPEDIYVDAAFEQVYDEALDTNANTNANDVKDKSKGADDDPGVNMRKQLDGGSSSHSSRQQHALTAHSAPSDFEKLLKDPLAKHKLGEGVVIPAVPTKSSSSSSSREHKSDKASKSREGGAAPMKAVDENASRTRPAPATAPAPAVPTGGGFAIFSDPGPAASAPAKPVSKPVAEVSESSAVKPSHGSERKPSSKASASSAFPIFDDSVGASAKKSTEVKAQKPVPAASKTGSMSMGFDIFCDSGGSGSGSGSGVEASKKKEAVVAKKPESSSGVKSSSSKMGFDIFGDDPKSAKKPAARSPKKSSSTGFEIFSDTSKAEKVVEKAKPLAPAPAPVPAAPTRSHAMPTGGIFDDLSGDEEEIAYDDTTINTKIAKMDIDAMFFDCDDDNGGYSVKSSSAPATKPMNLSTSSSCVFPAANSFADARQHLAPIPEDADCNNGSGGSSGSKKDGGFVVFDDFSVIRSVRDATL